MTLRPLRIALLWVCLLGLPMLAFWLGWRVLEVKNITKDGLSRSRYAQLRLMLLAYHDEHGAFPPTKYQPTPRGPVHSWRVLLMPYTTPDFRRRYVMYDFSQEWNSPNNMQAVGGKPYFRYFTMKDDTDITDYLAIGDGDDWPSDRPLSSLLVTRDKDRFLVVEYQDSGVHWMEPKY